MSGEGDKPKVGGLNESPWGNRWDSFADLEEKREALEPEKVEGDKENTPVIDVEELKSSYPKNEGESDEDYEKRIASMKEKAEAGSSKLEKADEKEKENREAANKVEALIKGREEKAAKTLEENTKKVIEMVGVDKDNADLKAAIEKQKKKDEAKIENLKKRLDAAIANGTTAELLEELELDNNIEDEFTKSQEDADWVKTDSPKESEIEAKFADRFKTVYEKLGKIDNEIKSLEDKIGNLDDPEGAAKSHAEEQKKKAEELTAKYIEKIDGADNLDAVAKQNQKDNAKAHYDRIIEKIDKELQEKLDNIDSKLAELNERREKRKELKDALFNMNNNIRNEKAAVRREFDRSISRPEDGWTDEERENMNKLRMENSEEYEKKYQEAQDERIKNPELFKEDKKKYWEDQKKHWRFFKEHEKENLNQLKESGRLGTEEQKFDTEEPKSDAEESKPSAEEAAEEVVEGIFGEKKEKLGKLKLDDCVAENLEELEKTENKLERVIKDHETRKKYGNVATYISDVKIEADKPADYYVEEMKRVFKDEDLNDEAWTLAEEKMRTKYDNVKDRMFKEEEKKSEAGIDIATGAEEHATTVEGKMDLLRNDAGEYDNGRAFVRNFDPEIFARNGDMPKVKDVMDKIVRPKFFMMGFDIAGKTRAKYDKIADRLIRKYAEYGYDADGKKIDYEVKIKNKWLARQIRKRIVFSKGEK